MKQFQSYISNSKPFRMKQWYVQHLYIAVACW